MGVRCQIWTVKGVGHTVQEGRVLGLGCWLESAIHKPGSPSRYKILMSMGLGFRGLGFRV